MECECGAEFIGNRDGYYEYVVDSFYDEGFYDDFRLITVRCNYCPFCGAKLEYEDEDDEE